MTARRKISPDEHNVLIVLLDADRDVVESVEKLLERNDACAVYAGTRQALQGIVPSKPKSEDFQRMLQSGRWSLASYGWDETDPDSASAYGARGTPLTHRRVRDGKKESLEEYRARVDRLLRECAESLPTNAPRVLVYPDGNFGQSSLDISPEEIAALQEIVRKHFDYALYFEDPGFITPRHNDFRLPARLVPGDWDGERLMTHLRQRNPVTRAQLDLAKLLYWHRQHEAANVWFARAAAAGADAWEVQYNWGANAYQQGDLPTSRRKLRAAAELDPASKKKPRSRCNAPKRHGDRKPTCLRRVGMIMRIGCIGSGAVRLDSS